MYTFFQLYESHFPDELKPFAASPAMQRIGGIDMNCGMNYTSYPLFQSIHPYSRLTHSMAAAMIVADHTHSQTESLATLFHDIATPVFSHVIDFMNHDYQQQESTEALTAKIIMEDEVITQELKRLQIDPEEVFDYHRYPIADNDTPKLSADRLEYTLSNMMNYHFASPDEVKHLYEDLTVGINEIGEQELMFRSITQAKAFTLYSLRCSQVYVADEDRYAMEILARLIRQAMKDGILKEKNLYTREQDVIDRLMRDPLYRCKWLNFTRLSQIRKSPIREDEGYLKIDVKKRYINPYVLSQGRISELDGQVQREIEDFLQTDFNYFIKGC